MTLGSNLTRFRSSPEVPRLAVALLTTAAVMLAATGSWQLCGENECEGEPAIGALVRPSQMGSQPLLADSANGYLGTYAPGQVAPHDSKRQIDTTPLGCIKLYRGQWLRVEIQHKADRGLTKMKCFYGYGPQWEAL